MINRYQLAKARRIAAFLRDCADKTMEATSPWMLSQMTALLTDEEWRTVCLAAGVAVADLEAKAAVLAILRGKAPHLIGRRKVAA